MQSSMQAHPNRIRKQISFGFGHFLDCTKKGMIQNGKVVAHLLRPFPVDSPYSVSERYHYALPHYEVLKILCAHYPVCGSILTDSTAQCPPTVWRFTEGYHGPLSCCSEVVYFSMPLPTMQESSVPPLQCGSALKDTTVGTLGMY